MGAYLYDVPDEARAFLHGGFARTGAPVPFGGCVREEGRGP